MFSEVQDRILAIISEDRRAGAAGRSAHLCHALKQDAIRDYLRRYHSTLRPILLSEADREALLRFNLGFATYAVQFKNWEAIKYGLKALAIEGAVTDYRETLRYLSFLHDAAAQLGATIDECWWEIKGELPDLASTIDELVREGSRHPSGFGYRRTFDADGAFTGYRQI